MVDDADRGEPGAADDVAERVLAAERLAQWEPEAVAEAYERVGPRVAAFLDDRGEAEDCLQDALLELADGQRGYEPERGTPHDYLYGIARNKARARLRERGRLRPEPPEKVASRLEREIDAGEPIFSTPILEPRLERLIEKLPRFQRQVLGLRYWYDLKPGEIATRLDCDVTRVYEAQRSALDSLRGWLAPGPKSAPPPSRRGGERRVERNRMRARRRRMIVPHARRRALAWAV